MSAPPIPNSNAFPSAPELRSIAPPIAPRIAPRIAPTIAPRIEPPILKTKSLSFNRTATNRFLRRCATRHRSQAVGSRSSAARGSRVGFRRRCKRQGCHVGSVESSAFRRGTRTRLRGRSNPCASRIEPRLNFSPVGERRSTRARVRRRARRRWLAPCHATLRTAAGLPRQGGRLARRLSAVPPHVGFGTHHHEPPAHWRRASSWRRARSRTWFLVVFLLTVLVPLLHVSLVRRG